MTHNELAGLIAATAQEIFKQPGLTYAPDTFFRDILGFDSVQAVHFILAIEAAAGVTINEEDVDDMHTMGNLMEVLLRNQSLAPVQA